MKDKVYYWIEKQKIFMKEGYTASRYHNAFRIIEDNCRYKKPAFINMDRLNTVFDNMWVMPIFMKPGKNDIMIRSPLDKEVA